MAAESERDARKVHPSEFVTHISNGLWMGTYSKCGSEYETENDRFSCWVECPEIEEINVEYLGKTNKERGVICASFNAG